MTDRLRAFSLSTCLSRALVILLGIAALAPLVQANPRERRFGFVDYSHDRVFSLPDGAVLRFTGSTVVFKDELQERHVLSEMLKLKSVLDLVDPQVWNAVFKHGTLRIASVRFDHGSEVARNNKTFTVVTPGWRLEVSEIPLGTEWESAKEWLWALSRSIMILKSGRVKSENDFKRLFFEEFAERIDEKTIKLADGTLIEVKNLESYNLLQRWSLRKLHKIEQLNDSDHEVAAALRELKLKVTLGGKHFTVEAGDLQPNEFQVTYKVEDKEVLLRGINGKDLGAVIAQLAGGRSESYLDLLYEIRFFELALLDAFTKAVESLGAVSPRLQLVYEAFERVNKLDRKVSELQSSWLKRRFNRKRTIAALQKELSLIKAGFLSIAQEMGLSPEAVRSLETPGGLSPTAQFVEGGDLLTRKLLEKAEAEFVTPAMLSLYEVREARRAEQVALRLKFIGVDNIVPIGPYRRLGLSKVKWTLDAQEFAVEFNTTTGATDLVGTWPEWRTAFLEQLEKSAQKALADEYKALSQAQREELAAKAAARGDLLRRPVPELTATELMQALDSRRCTALMVKK